MKTFVVFTAAVAVAIAAPSSIDGEVYELRRSKKSYGAQSYGVPAAQSYGAPGAPAPCGGGAPLALYLAPQQQSPQYREDEETEHEHEHNHASARSYFDGSAGALAGLAAPAGLAGLAAPAGLAAGLNLSPAPAQAGPAVGVFPNAKLGGCAVPLLLSCAPTVVSGHVAKSHGYGSSGHGAGSAGGYGGAAAGGYALSAAPAYKEAEEMKPEGKAWQMRDSHMGMKEAGVQKEWSPAHAAHESLQDTHQHQHHHETSASVNKL